MSSFFLPSYETSPIQRLVFPLFSVYSYRHYEEFCNPEIHWQGRAIHLLTSMVYIIPGLGAILSIAEYAWYLHSESAKALEFNPLHEDEVQEKIIEEPAQKPIEIKVDAGKDEKTDAQKKKIYQSRLEDREDSWEKLQLEWASGEGSKTGELVDLEKPEEKRDGVKTGGQEENWEDIQLKWAIEGGSDNEGTPLSVQSENSVEGDDVALQILVTPGLSSEDSDVYDFGVEELWTLIAMQTKYHPHALSLGALKKQRNVNIEQYMALKLKRFGHANSLVGTIPLPSGKNIKMEGFYEVFVVPMLTASFSDWSQTYKGLSKEDSTWIKDAFHHIILNDFMTPADIQERVEEILSPSFVGPLVFGTGFQNHSASATLIGDFLLYSDRSGFNNEPGVYIYRINRELMTTDFIKELTRRDQIKQENYQMVEKIVSELNGEVVHHVKMAAQKSGNCTYASMKTTLFVLTAFKRLLNQIDSGTLSVETITDTDWEDAFAGAKVDYAQFSSYDRRMVNQDFIEEVGEWLEGTTSFCENELKNTYIEALTSFVGRLSEKEVDADRHATLAQAQSMLQDLCG